MAANGTNTPQGWWMYQGGPAHGGYVTDTPLSSSVVNPGQKPRITSVQLGGPILSVPAVVDGYAYVGVANSHKVPGSNGGGLYRVELATGTVMQDAYTWTIPLDQRDSHGFTGMGCTPAVANGNVYFMGFDGWLYCVSQSDLTQEVWKTNLRQEDLDKNQPVTNDFAAYAAYPPAAGWSSPVVVGNQVFVGIGEGENPSLFGFVFCLAADTGVVQWVFCTNQLDPPNAATGHAGTPNRPNQLPAQVVQLKPGETLPTMFTTTPAPDTARGASVWSGIAYDDGLLYVTTGNPVNVGGRGVDHGLPVLPNWTDPHGVPGCKAVVGPTSIAPYSYSVLILDAACGDIKAQFTPTQDTSYRPSDGDIDFGGSAAVFTDQAGQKLVAVANKNGTLFLLDPQTLEVVATRQLLPYDVNGQRIPSVDPHPADKNHVNPITPPNCESDQNWNENYSGVFGAPAVIPSLGLIFVGMGGPNYHYVSPGIDYQSTPFMRAIKWDPATRTLDDAWEMQPFTFQLPTGPVTVQRYVKPAIPTAQNQTLAMYMNPGEASIGSPAVANDVVFVGTHNVALYAFRATDGTLLWSDALGMQTLGLNGGYGYCMGAAVWQNYVVAGALVQGRDGGVLRIYQWPAAAGGAA
jgi:outer membrane protein assembly factor BamB